MMVRYSFYLICLFLSPAVIVPVKAQVNIRLLAARAEAYNQYLSPEKLYLHFDKSDYTAGDTLWFKAYLFNGISLSGSEKSGIYYIELADDSNKVVKRLKFPIH